MYEIKQIFFQYSESKISTELTYFFWTKQPFLNMGKKY